jgi:hypothetical protein
VLVAFLCVESAARMSIGREEIAQIETAVALAVDWIGKVTMHLVVKILVWMVILSLDVIMSRA